MIVFVSEQLDHQLKPANFRNFSIEIAAPRVRLRELSRLLKDVVDFEDEFSAWSAPADYRRCRPSGRTRHGGPSSVA
jgi:hypothetical protein